MPASTRWANARYGPSSQTSRPARAHRAARSARLSPWVFQAIPTAPPGAQDRDPHGQGVLEQLGRAAVPPPSRPAAAVRDAVRRVRDDDIDPAALEQLRRREGVGRIQEERLRVVAADLRLEQVAEPPPVAA